MPWGGGTFTQAMDNLIPGTYVNINVTAQVSRITSGRGYLASPIELDWGKDGEVITVTAETYQSSAKELLGKSAGAEGLENIEEMLLNASTLYLYRINSGKKAEGKFGTAQCSGILGNDITVVIEEDPDNPGDEQPDTSAAIVKGNGNTFTVAYSNMYDQRAQIKVTSEGTEVDKAGNWSQENAGDNVYTVKLLETIEPGKTYTIEAWVEGGSEKLAEFSVEIPYPQPTAKIDVEGKVYTITYDKLYIHEAEVKVKDNGKGTDIEAEGNYSLVGENPYTLTILDTIMPGDYSVNAQIEDGTVLATQSFAVAEPTAEISVTKENEEYSIAYENLGAYTAEVKIKDETQDIEAGTKYELQGETASFTVKVKDELPGGDYTLEARAKHEEETKVLDSVSITLPKPTASITQKTEGESYSVSFENLRAEKGSVKLKKDGSTEVNEPEKISTSGENPIEVTITKASLDAGSYTLEAWTTNAKEALATAEFSKEE